MFHLPPTQSDSSYTCSGPPQRSGARGRQKRTATEKRSGKGRNNKRRRGLATRERRMLLNPEGQAQRSIWCGKYHYIGKYLKSFFNIFSQAFSNVIFSTVNVFFQIYATKIDEFVCPPNISETVAVRIMTLAHRPPIASITIKLISKPILLSILSILLKTIQRIGAG